MIDQHNMAMCGISITEDRKARVRFSSPYYESSRAAIIRSDDLRSFANITTKEELGLRKRLAAQSGTTGLTIANEIAQNRHVIEQPTWELILLELLDRDVDAIILDRGTAQASVNRYGNLEILDIEFDTENYGIAINKKNKELLSSINRTIYNLQKSGEYTKLIENNILNYSQ